MGERGNVPTGRAPAADQGDAEREGTQHEPGVEISPAPPDRREARDQEREHHPVQGGAQMREQLQSAHARLSRWPALGSRVPEEPASTWIEKDRRREAGYAQFSLR